VKKTLILIAAVVVAGCSTAPPTIQQGPNAEVSFDGLHLIDNSVFQMAWADPDIDFSRYSKVMPGGATFQFRAVKKTGSSTAARRSNTTEFYIEDSDRERLETTVSDIFAEELSQSTRFTATDTAGQDVLIIRGGLQDIVSNTPPELMGRGNIFVSSVGEATLVVEIIDSMSGEVIFRAVERRAAQRPGGQMMDANSVTVWAEVRRLARNWATTLREGLDSIPTS